MNSKATAKHNIALLWQRVALTRNGIAQHATQGQSEVLKRSETQWQGYEAERGATARHDKESQGKARLCNTAQWHDKAEQRIAKDKHCMTVNGEGIAKHDCERRRRSGELN